ncbi:MULTISPECIES: PucR family transcriptional regulator [unclassified Microbacterium]|uniref:PucR family transcriptional regulator n=1 Tax=unclassified Microbacterium TaxID=2609290 RepID=UPI00203D73EA|nr:helix-turn-helix domain-containing protein [Microbacterium sp. USTB-Y]
MTTRKRTAAHRACAQVEEGLDALAAETTDHVRAEIAGYALVPLETHRATVRDTIRALLHALAADGSLSAEDARAIRYAALRREAAGIPVQDVLAAFHVVGRDVWDALSHVDGIAPSTLVQLADPLWSWIQKTSAHVAEAFAGGGGAHGRQVVLRQRLLESVRAGDAAEGDAVENARRLGFVPGGLFRAVCTEAGPWVEGDLELLQKGLSRLPGTNHAGLHGTLMIVLCQGASPEAVSEEVHRQLPGRGSVGVGLERPGVSGAETSIGDAERALRVAWPDSVSFFERAWLHSGLVDARTRLTPLYGDAKAVAAEHPGLAEAVRAFADEGFSLAAAAAALQLHPNTVAYRLDRWQELTGHDPRRFDGLALSMLSIGPPR